MSDLKIASSGAAILREVAKDGNLAKAAAVERAHRKCATVTASPVRRNKKGSSEMRNLSYLTRNFLS